MTSIGVRLDQQRYTEKVLGLVGTGTKKNPSPSNATDKLGEDTRDYSPEQSEFVRTYPYSELVGATLHLVLHTGPDVGHAVGVQSRQCKQWSLAQCRLMVLLRKYIQGFPYKDIRCSGCSFDLRVFSVSDWAGDRVAR